MKEYKILKANGTEKDMSLFGALPHRGVLEISVIAENTDRVTLIIHSDGMSGSGEKSLRIKLEKAGDSRFKAELDLSRLVQQLESELCFYMYETAGKFGTCLWGGEEPTELLPADKNGERQLLIYSDDFTTPDFIKQGIIYHIFADRFFSSGKCRVKSGCIINHDWNNGIPAFPEFAGEPFDNNEFFGGDLWGVAEKLPYLESLGVNCIYLSPIFESPSNHKYDTADYLNVDSMFGGNRALENLIFECKKLNIHIILDGVFNHTGSDSIYFNKKNKYLSNGAYNSRKSPYYSWYSFTEYPEKYECWWGIDILPKVNCDNPSYRNFIFGESGVIPKYMKMGIDGFRLDVADELSPAFIRQLRKTVKKYNPDAVVLGEVWEDASNKIAYSERREYLSGNQLDSVMNYPLRSGIISFVKDGNADYLKAVTEGIYRRYPKCVSDCLMNFLGTHDTARILTVLGGEGSDGRSNRELSVMKMTEGQIKHGIRLLKCAFTVLYFMYGVPSVFYGDEAGSEGYCDPFCRKPFPWGSENREILDYIRKLGEIRKKEAVLKEGFFKILRAEKGLFVFERFDETSRLITAVNVGEAVDISDITDNCRNLLSTDFYSGSRLEKYTAAVFKSEA